MSHHKRDAFRDPTDYESQFVRELRKAEDDERAEAMVVEFREKLLRPFDEMRRDFDALGDRRVARGLDEIINTTRGVE